mgnify:CR=1 FL=1
MKTKFHLLGLLLLAINFATGQTWTSLNSPAGFKNVRDMSINHHGDTLYAADELGLLKSNDSGKS